MKVHINGMLKGNLGLVGCGGIFWDRLCNFFGAFSSSLGEESIFYAKLYSLILAIKMASKHGLLDLWIESDNCVLLVLYFLFASLGSED